MFETPVPLAPFVEPSERNKPEKERDCECEAVNKLD